MGTAFHFRELDIGSNTLDLPLLIKDLFGKIIG
jgi:hypothetical protein